MIYAIVQGIDQNLVHKTMIIMTKIKLLIRVQVRE